MARTMTMATYLLLLACNECSKEFPCVCIIPMGSVNSEDLKKATPDEIAQYGIPGTNCLNVSSRASVKWRPINFEDLPTLYPSDVELVNDPFKHFWERKNIQKPANCKKQQNRFSDIDIV